MPEPGDALEPDAKRLLSDHPQNAPHPAWRKEDAKRNVLITANGTGTGLRKSLDRKLRHKFNA